MIDNFLISKRILKVSILNILCGIFYRITLDLIYTNYIVPKWGYSGFISDFSLNKYIVSWIIVLAFLINLVRNIYNKKPSNFIIILLHYLAFIPATTLVAYYPSDVYFIFLLLLYWGLLNLYDHFIPNLSFTRPNKREARVLFYILVLLFVIIVWFVSIRYSGLRINLNIFEAYDLREESLNYNMPTILNYIFSASRIIIPTAMIYFMSKGKKLLFIGTLITGILLFSVNGQRTVFFTLILAFAGYVFYKENVKEYFSLFFLGINSLGIFEAILTGSSFIIDVIIRRIFFLPQLLNYYYYDFFSQNEFDYFRQGFLGDFGIESPYQVSITLLIGSIYQGGNANNGLFSDAFYNLGVLGIIIMPLLIIFALRILDASSKGLENKILVASIISLTINFLSSSFFTILLTHGFIAICMILYLMPREQ